MQYHSKTGLAVLCVAFLPILNAANLGWPWTSKPPPLAPAHPAHFPGQLSVDATQWAPVSVNSSWTIHDVSSYPSTILDP